VGQLFLSKLSAPAGSQLLSFKGQLTGVATTISPASTGVRAVISTQTGTLLDATVPAGAGWRTSITGATSMYLNPDDPNGIVKVLVATNINKPGFVKFIVKGRGLSLPTIAQADLPLAGQILLDAAAGASGPCGATVFPVDACAMSLNGNAVKCK
jgi:hypothetical protein